MTQRLKMEAALRESGKRYRALLNMGPMAVYYCNAEGVIEEFNRRAEELWGRKPAAKDSKERFCGSWKLFRPNGSFMPHDQCPMAEVLRRDISAARNMEVVIERPDGSRISALVDIRPLKNKRGQIAGAINCFYDITPRKRTDDLLRESEINYRNVVEGSLDAIVTSEPPPGRFLSGNSAALKMFGAKSQAQFLSLGPIDLSPRKQPDGRDSAEKAREMVEIVLGKGSHSFEWMHRRLSGETFLTEVRLTPILQGGNVFMVADIRDISERKRVEEELLASRAQLRALARRIQAAREEERGHAAREIHDVLAQELTGIKMEAAWLGRRLAEPLDGLKKKALRNKVRAIMDLTDKASESARRIASELRPVVLDSLGLRAATAWVASDFQKRMKVRCKASVPPGHFEIDDDRSTALYRILQESLTNIARHAKARRVNIHLRLKAGEAILKVEDNGRGIRPGEITNPRSLGLLGMRERACLLDGKCTIAPRAGGGTVVEVRLPKARSIRSNHP